MRAWVDVRKDELLIISDKSAQENSRAQFICGKRMEKIGRVDMRNNKTVSELFKYLKLADRRIIS